MTYKSRCSSPRPAFLFCLYNVFFCYLCVFLLIFNNCQALPTGGMDFTSGTTYTDLGGHGATTTTKARSMQRKLSAHKLGTQVRFEFDLLCWHLALPTKATMPFSIYSWAVNKKERRAIVILAHAHFHAHKSHAHSHLTHAPLTSLPTGPAARHNDL